MADTRPDVEARSPDTPAELLAVGFPGVELVAAAAALLRSDIPRWDGREDERRFLAEVAPGLVALRVVDPARRERRADNPELTPFRGWDARHPELAARRSAAALATPLRPVGDLHLGDKGYAAFLDADAADELRADEQHESWRQVTSWSAKSRRRMVRTMAELDYAPLFGEGIPAMLTLTYPGSWAELVPTGKACKRHFRLLQLRWRRRWGRKLRCVWKLEFQRRGAPHLHLFAVPPGDPVKFRAWLSLTWAAIVNADAGSGERRRHVLAGTAVDFAEASRMRDPRRLAVYFLKHGTKTADDKEYQHNVPELWQARGAGPGRFWGYLGLDKATVAVELTEADFTRAKRLLRRWSRAQGRSLIRP